MVGFEKGELSPKLGVLSLGYGVLSLGYGVQRLETRVLGPKYGV